MKLKGKSRNQARNLIKYIESLGGKLQKECPGGSIYCSLNAIRQIRISDHIALKGDIDRIDIIIKDSQFLCIYYRDIKIYNSITKVKQWIENVEYTVAIILRNMATVNMLSTREYEIQIDNLKKEILLKEQKCKEYKEKIKSIKLDNTELKNQLTSKTAKVERLQKSVDKNSKYIDMYQKLVSNIKKHKINIE